MERRHEIAKYVIRIDGSPPRIETCTSNIVLCSIRDAPAGLVCAEEDMRAVRVFFYTYNPVQPEYGCI